jgi:alpha-D-xyloside xylohydrolase
MTAKGTSTQRNSFARRARAGILLSVVSSIALSVVSPLSSEESDTAGPRGELIAPGVWRIRFGTPERFAPTHFRSAGIAKAGLEAMPGGAAMPLDLGKVSFATLDRGCALLLPMMADESIYGFGLHTKLFDMTQSKVGQNGRRVFLAPTDNPENERGESHAPVPFYVSTAGYGVFVDTARFASFYTGNAAPVRDRSETAPDETHDASSMLVDVPVAKGVDVYVFAGPTMLDAVRRYNLFSGGGALPPLWGLGVHYRGYGKLGAEETLALAGRLRADRIPCDVWGVEPGWQTEAYSSSFVWNTEKFPDPDRFLAQMRAMGFRMNFWQQAFTHPTSPMHGALKPWSGSFLVWKGLMPDFASSRAREVFLEQNKSALLDRGVEALKLDECDYQPESPTPWSFPLATTFPSGLDGELMHSLFGVLYQQTMLQPYRGKGLRTWGLVRNSQALAGPLPFVLYSDSYDARCYVRGLVNEGFCGLLWTPEVRDAGSPDELIRRLEVVSFAPATVINAWFIRNPPWDQVDRDKNNRNELMPEGERRALTEQVRRVLELRMSFIPYLYSAFKEYHLTGKPPVRALVLDWPGDPKVRQIDDEFMFGDSVLVAPLFAGQKSRQVYLPAGDWYDFWSRERRQGGRTIGVANAVGQIPLFVKSGTLLPLAKPVESIKPDTCFEITAHIVGENAATFTLYEDDGISTDFASGNQGRVVLKAGPESNSVSRTGDYHGPLRYKITAWREF